MRRICSSFRQVVLADSVAFCLRNRPYLSCSIEKHGWNAKTWLSAFFFHLRSEIKIFFHVGNHSRTFKTKIWWETEKMKKGDKKDRNANSNKFDLVSNEIKMFVIVYFNAKCKVRTFLGTFISIPLPWYFRWWVGVYIRSGFESTAQTSRFDERRGKQNWSFTSWMFFFY